MKPIVLVGVVVVAVAVLVHIGQTAREDAVSAVIRDTRPILSEKDRQNAFFVAGQIEHVLLSSGIDAQAQAASDDPRALFIFGPSINRPMAYRLIQDAKLRKIIALGRYSKVTFTNSITEPTFNQEYSLK